MESTINERIKMILEAKNLSVNAFSKALDMPQVTVNNYVKGNRKISFELIERIAQVYPDISKKWLLSGEGDMVESDRPPSNEVVPYINPRRNGIPLVSQYAYAGYLSGYADQEYMDSLPIVDFTPDREMTGNWLAFEVRGDSMDDGSRESYCQGDIVITREVKPYLWKDSKLHIHRRDFVIVHEEGILIKRIIDHDVDRHLITIHSLNPDYSDRIIDLAQVRKIFSIVESRQNRAR